MQNKRSTYLEDVFSVLTGTTISQIIVIIASPILTRLYQPDMFGVMAAFMAIIAVVNVISTLRYDLAIVLAKNDEIAFSLLWISLISTILFTVISSIVVSLLKDQIVLTLNIPGLDEYLWLVPFFIFFWGIFDILTQWNARKKKFTVIATTQVTNSVTSTSAKLIVGIMKHPIKGGLIIGTLIGKIFAISILFNRALGSLHNKNAFKFNLKRISNSFVSYKRFPLYNAPASLLNTISQQIPALLISLYFSPIVLGYYAITLRILKLPTQLIGNSIRQVFFQRASEAMNDTGNITIIVRRTFESLFRFSLLPFTVIFVLSPYVFGFVFGNDWSDSGIYSRLLSPWIYLVFLTTPISSIISVTGKEFFGLRIQMIILISRIGSFVIGGVIFKDAVITIILFSAVGSIYQVYFLFWILKEAKTSYRIIFRYMKEISLSFIYILITIFLEYVGHGTVVNIVLLSIIILGVFFFLVKKELKALLDTTGFIKRL